MEARGRDSLTKSGHKIRKKKRATSTYLCNFSLSRSLPQWVQVIFEAGGFLFLCICHKAKRALVLL